MPGRTLIRFCRVYIDGVNMSGYGRAVGPLVADFAPTDLTAIMSDEAHGFLPNNPTFTPTVFNAVLDDTATTGPVAFNSGKEGQARHLLIALGDRAAPVIGVPVFWGVYQQLDFSGQVDGGAAVVNMQLSGFDVATASALLYTQVWGHLLHAYGSEDAANTANTNIDGLAPSAKGGIFVYQIESISGGGGTVTLSVDESATGVGAWGALSGATSGAIAAASAPTAGYVQLATNADVKRYLRFQVAFGAPADGVVFAAAFIRGQ